MTKRTMHCKHSSPLCEDCKAELDNLYSQQSPQDTSNTHATHGQTAHVNDSNLRESAGTKGIESDRFKANDTNSNLLKPNRFSNSTQQQSVDEQLDQIANQHSAHSRSDYPNASKGELGCVVCLAAIQKLLDEAVLVRMETVANAGLKCEDHNEGTFYELNKAIAELKTLQEGNRE